MVQPDWNPFLEQNMYFRSVVNAVGDSDVLPTKMRAYEIVPQGTSFGS